MAEIEADFHAGVATADDEHLLSPESLAGLIVADMHQFIAEEFMHTGDLRHHAIRILPGGHHQPLADVLHLCRRPPAAHPPHPARVVELGGRDGDVEPRVQLEVASVGLQVSDELSLGRILREVAGEGELRQLAKLIREVELQPVVRPVLPQRGNAVGFLEDDEWHAVVPQARAHGQPRRACADDQRPVNPLASPPKQRPVGAHHLRRSKRAG